MSLTYKRGLLVGFVGLFAIVGTVLLFGTRAAGPNAAQESENGTLAGGASLVTDSAASGGKYVQFGTKSAAYSVVGNTIENGSGQPVVLHGVDRPSLEWSCSGFSADKQPTGIPASDFATMRTKWNANAVRIALNQDHWLKGAAQYCGDNGTSQTNHYAATVQAAVQAAEANGLIVILDLHWSDQGNLQFPAPPNGQTNQQCMPDQNSVTFWQQVAAVYKNDPNVWFELYNEPHPNNWTIWKNGGSVCGFQAVGMQTLVDTVRTAGASNLVLAGGDSYASHLDGVPLLSGSNIVYAIHPYANPSNPDSWDKSDGDWNNRFGNLSAQVPVVATEFGDLQCGSTYDQGILDYFRSKHIGYTAWAWYADTCGFPSLITDAAGDCKASMGCTIQQDMLSYH